MIPDRLTMPPGSSPHTRGALVLQLSALVELGIIPAYAGSTPTPTLASRSHADHPRIRGEHRVARSFRRRCRGSSPHTRGALVLQLSALVELGIIPAYAGSTFI